MPIITLLVITKRRAISPPKHFFPLKKHRVAAVAVVA
jgi:hypothetical protein